MKTRNLLLLTVLTSLALPIISRAGDVIKADNTTALNLAGSWLSGSPIPPDNTSVAVWNNTVTTAKGPALGGNLSLLGIRVTNPGGAPTIADTSTATLTLGTSGIDMSASSALVFTIASKITLGGNQTWSVATGASLQPATGTQGYGLNFGGNTLTTATAGTGFIQITSGYTLTNGTLSLGNAGYTQIQSGGSRTTTLGSDLNVTIPPGGTLKFGVNSAPTGGIAVTSAAPITVGGTLAVVSSGASGTNFVVQSGKVTLTNGATINNNVGFAYYAKFTGEMAISNSVTWIEAGGSTANTLFSGPLTGNGILAFQNTATARRTEFSGDNSAFTGTVNLNGASGNRNLRLTTATAGSASATWTVGSGNVLEVDGVAVNLGTLTGSGVVSNTHATATSALTVGAGTFSGVLTNGAGIGGMSLTKNTAGTLTLSGANLYSGATTISGGTLVLSGSGSIPSSSSIAINGSGAKFVQTSSAASASAVTLTLGTVDGTGTVGAVTVANLAGNTVQNGNGSSSSLTTSSLTFSGAGTLSIVESSGTAGSARVVVTGALATTPGSGTITVNGSGTWANGTNVLLSWGSGSPNVSDFTVGTISGLTSRQATNNPALSIVGKTLVLTVNGDSPKWTGVDSGNWVVGSTGASGNWKLITAGTATDYIQNDVVLFDDTAAGSTTLNISAANVSPASTEFTNSSKAYTLSSTGGFGIAAGSIVKNGNGMLTISNANTTSAGLQLNAGTLNVNNATALGSGTLTIASGTTLDSTGASAVTVANAQTWNGDFAFTGTKDLSLGTATMAASRQVTVNGGTLAVGGVAGSGLNLTKAGAGTLAIGASTYNGTTTVNGGALKATSATSFTTSSSFTLANTAGAALDLNGNSQTVNTITGGGATGGNILLNGATLTTGTAADNTFSGALSGAGGLVKNGAGRLILAGDKTGYTGTTTVNVGTLDLGTINGTFGPAVTVSSGTANNSIVVGANLFVQGNGTLNTGITGGSAGFGARGGNLTLNVGGAGASITMNSAGAGGVGQMIFGSPTSDSKVIVQNSINLNGTGTRTFTVNPGTGTASAEVSGLVTGQSMGIVKAGTGVLILSAANTYGNSTRVDAGTIAIRNNLALQNSAIDTTGVGVYDITGVTTPTIGGLSGSANLASVITTGYGSVTALTLNLITGNGANLGDNRTYSGIIADGASGMSLTKTGVGTTQTLSGPNTYTGNTTISAGTLALSGSGSIANTPNIAVASNAILNVSGLTLPFALGASQTLSNSAPGAVINGTNDCSAGTVSLVYDGTNPSFVITNGGMTLSAGTVIKVTKTGATLLPGTYKIISKATAGNVGLVAGAVTVPVVVGGSGSFATASLQITGGELYLTVAKAATTLNLVSSAQTNGYQDSVSFTATVWTNGIAAGNAGTNVIFAYTNLLTGVTPVIISTNSIVSGGSVASLAISNLPRGTNYIVAQYSGDTNYLASTSLILEQVVTNHPPVATNVAYARNAAIQQIKIAITNLLSNASDVDSDTLTLAAVSTTTNAATLLVSGGWVMYYNTNAVADEFTYAVSDGFGGTNSATVTLTVDSTPLFGQTTIPAVDTTGGTATLNFAGIPGYSYSVLRSTNLTAWASIWTTNAPVSGAFEYIDLIAPQPSAYYRLQYNP